MKCYYKRRVCILILSVIVLIVLLIVSLCCGRYPIAVKDCLDIIIGHNKGTIEYSIVVLLRLPRTLAAMLIGMALSLSGLLYQSTFNNKLISPDILGVSSGACVGAGIAILLGLSAYLVNILALLFGIVTVIISISIPKIMRNNSTMALVLSGLIVGAMMSSAIGLIKFLADPSHELADITYWMLGGIAGVNRFDIIILSSTMIVSIMIVFFIRRKIDAIACGYEEAQCLGINYKLYRLIVICISTLMTAVAVCISGSISWIGLVVPHVSRLIVGEKPSANILPTIIIGAFFMIIIDLIARTLSENEIPLSILTGGLCALLYLFLLIKKGRNLE